MHTCFAADLRMWFDRVLESVYSLLTISVRSCPHLYDNMHVHEWVASVFAPLVTLQHREMRSAIEKFVIYFIMHCPHHKYNEVLAPVLQG